MSIQITQTGGAGAAVADKGLSGAWLDVPITVTLSNVDMNAYEHTIEDQTTGLEIAVSNDDERIATFTPSGNRGSFRIRSGYREQSYSPWRYTYRVIRVERDSAGENPAAAPPALDESRSETAEDRGYAEQLDELFAQSAFAIGALPESDFTGVVSLTTSSKTVFAGSGILVLGLDDTSFRAGAQFELLIPAGTASAIEYGTNLAPEDDWDPFDSGADYWISVTAISADRLVSVGKSLVEPTSATPTIVSSEVSAFDLDKLVLTFSEACHFPDGSIVGVSLGGTMATPRTISSVFSGNGTTAITLDLDGDLLVTDTPTFVIASGRELRSMNGPKVAAGSTPIDFTDLDYDWSAVTGASFDLIGSAGIGVADAAVIPTWTDQIDGETATEATNRPIYRAAPAVLNGNPAVDFDGTNDKLVSSGVITAWLGSVGDFEIIAVVHADAVPGTTANFTAEGILAESSTRISMLLYLNGANYTLLGCVFDGGFKYAERVIGTSLPAKGFVAEMRLTGGNLTMSVNGVDGTPVACGPADVYGSFLRFGSNAGGTAFLNGQLARVVGKSGNGTKETAAINAFVTKYCT